MAALRLRDRDAIVTKEGLVFRIFGYSHPPNAYVCDAEYAPAEIFKSNNPKAPRSDGSHVFYKFYEDEGWKFIQERFPQYMIFHEMLQKKIVGIKSQDIINVRKPQVKLSTLFNQQPKDELVLAMQNVLDFVMKQSGLSFEDFGVFGSMLHGFHHPKFSDIDLIVYGIEKTAGLRKTLQEMYRDSSSPLKNEFETDESISGKRWMFQNLSPKEFVWHQNRKSIYGLFKDDKSKRIIKTEFEPVKDWTEIRSEYDSSSRIRQKGWVKMRAVITEDSDVPFIPSIYEIEPLEILEGPREAIDSKRIVSYLEEFRLQAFRDEEVYVEGSLEEMLAPEGSFYQVALTYCPRYYEQVLKVQSSHVSSSTI